MSRKHKQSTSVEEFMPDGAPVAPAESKGDKFVRLADRRLNRAVKDIRALIPLANRSAYEYTAADTEFIRKALADALADVQRAFEGQKQERPTLSLRAARESAQHSNNGMGQS